MAVITHVLFTVSQDQVSKEERTRHGCHYTCSVHCFTGPGVEGRAAERPLPGVCQPGQRGGRGHQPVHRLPAHRLPAAVRLWAGAQEGILPAEGKVLVSYLLKV